MRTLYVGVIALALSAVASAQFDGPAPLAWRWLQPTRVPPSGAPLVNGDVIYTAVGGRVFSLDKSTGNLKWKFPSVDPIDGVFRSAPILIDGTLIAVGDNKLVYGVDPTTGSMKWSTPLLEGSIGQPVAVGTNVAIAQSDDKLVVLDSGNGKPVWEQPYRILDHLVGQIGSYNGSILYFNGNSQLVSLNVALTKSDWRQTFSQVPSNAQPIVVGDTIYLNSSTYLVALNAATGHDRWQKNTTMSLNFAPCPGAAGILVTSVEGQAMIFSLDGQLVTRKPFDLGSMPIVQPSAAGDKFIVPTANGAINLIDSTTGSLLWSYPIRPLSDTVSGDKNNSNNPFGGGGMMGGGPMGGQMGGGGMMGGGGQRGNNRGNNNNETKKPVTVQASGPAVVSGQTLLVPARDGSILAFDKDLGVDLTPPNVTMQWPNPGEQVSGQPPLVFIFKIDDEGSGVDEKTLKIEIDGQPYEYKYGRDGIAQVTISNFTKNKPLSDGRKDVVVTVSDWMGNEIVQHYAVTVDNSLKPLALPGTDNKTNNPFGGPGGPGGRGPGGGKGGGGMGAPGGR